MTGWNKNLQTVESVKKKNLKTYSSSKETNSYVSVTDVSNCGAVQIIYIYITVYYVNRGGSSPNL